MNIGIVYSLLYIFCLVISTIWLQSLGKQYPIYLLLASSSFLAIVVFNGLNLKYIVTTHLTALKDYKGWFLLSLYLTLVWVFTYLGAVINSMIFLAIIFLANALFAAVHAKEWAKFGINFLIIFLICWVNRNNGVYLAEFYGALAGFFSFLYFSKSLDFSQKHHLTPIQVLSIRFYVLLLFSLTMLFFASPAVSISLTATEILMLVALAIVNQILPNFFSQSGLHHLGKKEFSFFVTLIPFLAYLSYQLIYQQWSYTMCILTFLATVSLNYDWLIKKFKGME